MNKIISKLSRRERLVVLAAAVLLFAGGVVYPALRASNAYRAEKVEELEAARSLRERYRTMIRTADQIREENGALKEALSKADGLLFERTGNDVMMEAAMIKRLNQMAPDLGLEISQTRSSLRGIPGQMNFSVKGTGRYPEILNFFYQLETHRPLIVVDQFDMAVQNNRRQQGGSRPLPPQVQAALQRRAAAEAAAAPAEPKLRLQMAVHINCRTAAEDGK